MTTNEAIAHFKLEPGAPITSEFIYLHLRQFDFSKLSSTSSIADAVNSKTVREIPILVPSFEVLRAFQDQVGVLFSALKNREQYAQSIAQMRDALLPRLISGQLTNERDFPVPSDPHPLGVAVDGNAVPRWRGRTFHQLTCFSEGEVS
jgi:type I restriction enzyme S subunit